MKLIIGLGNPGKQYTNTRHNLGFQVLDLLAGSELWENKHDCKFLKLADTILAKPQLYMNNSGKAVAEILKYYPAAELIVIHDDLDLPLGSLKIIKNSSAAGHNGVQSIIDELGTRDFVRIRLGINNPETYGHMEAEDYVLQKFNSEEEQILKEVLEKAVSAVEILETQGLETAQSKFNG